MAMTGALNAAHSSAHRLRHREDTGMGRKSGWLALALGVALAGAGGAVAYFLTGGPWAAVGAAIGAVAGAFAPTARDRMRERDTTKQSWRDTAERTLPESLARLLDPRREVVDFVGREEELTALLAWCEDDQASRLRLVTGPGGV